MGGAREEEYRLDFAESAGGSDSKSAGADEARLFEEPLLHAAALVDDWDGQASFPVEVEDGDLQLDEEAWA